MSPEDSVYQSAERMDGLAPLLTPLGTHDEFWNGVHSEIQKHLANLDGNIRSKVAGAVVQEGQTRGDNFYLYSYRKFCMPSGPVDPVIVGITFTSFDNEVQVDSDISGEETGDLILCLPKLKTGMSRKEILGAARASAIALNRAADAVVAALENPARRID